MARNSGGSVIGKFFYLILQLAVVFAGVYAAFVLDEKKQLKNEKIKAIQIYEYMINETALIDSSKIQFDKIDSAISLFVRKYKSGEMPDINFFEVSFASSISNNVWNSVMNSGGMNVIDFKTVTAIDMYITERDYLFKTFEKGITYQKDLILPNLDRGKYEFYDFKTKELRPKYNWFVPMLSNLQSQLRHVSKRNKSMNEMLKKNLEQLKEDK